MSLSDQLLKLSNQAKQLEASAAAAKDKNEQKIKARKAQLHDSLASSRNEMKSLADEADDKAAAAVTEQKKKISESFADLRTKSAAQRARWSAKRAEHEADIAEDDALDDIDFASTPSKRRSTRSSTPSICETKPTLRRPRVTEPSVSSPAADV